MEWLKPLRGAVVGLDTAPLIYFIEENASYLPLVRPFFEAVDRGEFRVVTSVLTLTEVLIHPMRKGDPGLADRYRQILLAAYTLRRFRCQKRSQRRRRNCELGTGCELPTPFNWQPPCSCKPVFFSRTTAAFPN